MYIVKWMRPLLHAKKTPFQILAIKSSCSEWRYWLSQFFEANRGKTAAHLRLNPSIYSSVPYPYPIVPRSFNCWRCQIKHKFHKHKSAILYLLYTVYMCAMWPLALGEQGQGMLRTKCLDIRGKGITGGWRKLHFKEFLNLYCMSWS
jgi:hypothetical protein